MMHDVPRKKRLCNFLRLKVSSERLKLIKLKYIKSQSNETSIVATFSFLGTAVSFINEICFSVTEAKRNFVFLRLLRGEQ